MKEPNEFSCTDDRPDNHGYWASCWGDEDEELDEEDEVFPEEEPFIQTQTTVIKDNDNTYSVLNTEDENKLS